MTPRCGHERVWSVRTRRLDECSRCGHQTSLTAGTVMHGSCKPLKLRFATIDLFAVSKQGISAKSLERQRRSNEAVRSRRVPPIPWRSVR